CSTPRVAYDMATWLEFTPVLFHTVGGPTTFSIVGGADMGLFQLAVDGHHLEFVSAKDFETDAHTYHVTVRASDGANTTDQPITVSLTDVNDNAPVLTSSATPSVAENSAAV